ncbi:MAG: hypothetical protein ACO1QR_06320 [Chthoniobacteraceae bacterium]
MKFAVATYGSRHIGMLLAHLESLYQSHPGVLVEVYHQDLPAHLSDAIAKTYPNVSWVETAFDFTRDRIQRISSKTLAWEQALRRQPTNEKLILLDVDTLVIRDLSQVVAGEDWDVLFTWKDEQFVLNTGVLVCRVNAAARAFFTAWKERTLAILSDPERYRVANDSRNPFGASDQMALHELLGYRLGRTNYEVPVEGGAARLRGVPCAILNETNSCPVSEQTHVIHYKGGWQPILLDGRRFTKHRRREACDEMYRLYLATFRSGLERVKAATGLALSADDFHIAIPGYVDSRSPLRRRVLYIGHLLRDYVRTFQELAAGAARVAARRLSSCRS